jgi:hypothetical protein
LGRAATGVSSIAEVARGCHGGVAGEGEEHITHNTELVVKHMKVINDGRFLMLTTLTTIPDDLKGDRR